MQVWHPLQHSEPRNKCPNLKGCISRGFESKGRGLTAGLQSSAKVARNFFLFGTVFLHPPALGMLLHPNPDLSVSQRPPRKTCWQRHRRRNHTNREPSISVYHVARLKGDKRSHAHASASIIFRIVFQTPSNPQDCGRLAAFV